MTNGTPLDRVMANAVSQANPPPQSIAMTPVLLNEFNRGSWQGYLRVNQTYTDLKLRFSQGGKSGLSKLFDVVQTWHVDAVRGNDTNSGLTLVAAKRTIQAAINAAASRDVVLVQPGTYLEALNFSGKDIRLTSTDPGNQKVVAATVIDGNGQTQAVLFNSGETRKAVLSGFTIKNATNCINIVNASPTIGNCQVVGSSLNPRRGVQISGSAAPALRGLTIRDQSIGGGAGLLCSGYCSPSLSGLQILNNIANFGGAIHATNAALLARGVLISGNQAVQTTGSALYLAASPGLIEDSTIASNSGVGNTIEIANGSAVPTRFSNTLFWNNTPNTGTVVKVSSGSSQLTHCTFSAIDNGRLHVGGSASATLKNSILWQGSASAPYLVDAGGSLTAEYSDIKGGYIGVGNLNGDPQLTAQGALSAASPCIDVGSPTPRLYIDRFQVGRPQGSRVDIGAYEYPGANADSDGDGIPNDWEIAHGLIPGDARDGRLDPDGDGLVNLEEYYAGTNPWIDETPIAVDDLYRIARNSSYLIGITNGLLLNDRNYTGGSSYSVTIATLPEQGVLTVVAGNSVRYQPHTDYVGSDRFSYVIVKTINGVTFTSLPAVVTVWVNPAPVVANPLPDVAVNKNDAPTIVDLTSVFSIPNDSSAVIVKTATSYNPSLVAAVVNGNQLTLTYTANWTGTATIEVFGSLNGQTVADTFRVTVNGMGATSVVGAYPVSGSTVALPLGGQNLRLTIPLSTATSPANIKLYDRHGNDLTGHATIAANGLEIEIDPADGLQNPNLSEYLTGIAHHYTVVLSGASTSAYTISFNVDVTLPNLTASPGGGRFQQSFFDPIALTASEPNALIYYSLDGSPPTLRYDPIDPNDRARRTLSTNTVLKAYAVDAAGNVGPEQTFVYFFADLPLAPVVRAHAFSLLNNRVNGSWIQPLDPAHEIVEYRIYRALNPFDVERLRASREGGYPPPEYLRLNLAAPMTATSYIETADAVRSGVAHYGVTAVDRQGNESAISALTAVNLTATTTVGADVEAAIKRAAQWLDSQQHANGYWGGVDEDRLATTATVLNGLGCVPQWAVDHRHGIRRGLAYLQGYYADNNEALAGKIAALQRYSQNTASHHNILDFHAYKQGTNLMGWGLQNRYYPEPLSTALGIVAGDGAIYGSVTLTAAESYLNGSDLRALPGAYGWTPKCRDNSIYVASQVYRALKQHRYNTASNYQWAIDLQNLASGSPDYGAFNNDLLDTAAALVHLPVITTANRNLARVWLAQKQQINGSWNHHPWLTGLCLEALAAKKVLYVWSGATNDHDTAVRVYLTNRGYQVIDIPDSDPLPANLNEYALIFISGSVTPGNVGNKYRDTNLPVMVCHADLYDDLGMTSVEVGNAGLATAQTQVSVQNAHLNHLLTAKLTAGNQNVEETSETMSWGKPNETAVTIATLPGDTSKSVIFGYDQQALMAGGIPAPARRVGFFLQTNGHKLTANGKDLFDAAIEWSTARFVW